MGRSYVRTWDTYISQSGADLLNSYHRNNLNPYINFHRPCFFPVVTIDQKGKVKKKYPYEKINTPYEKLKWRIEEMSLPRFRPGAHPYAVSDHGLQYQADGEIIMGKA